MATGSGRANRPAALGPCGSGQQLTTGLALLATLPETPQHGPSRACLAAHPGRGTVDDHKGRQRQRWSRPITRARALCQQVGETPQLLPTLRGLWRFYLGPGAVPTARELGEQLLRLAQRAPDPAHRLARPLALGGPGATWVTTPRPSTHLEQGIALTTQTAHEPWRSRRGRRRVWPACAMAAKTLWCLGYPAQALRRSPGGAWPWRRRCPIPIVVAMARCMAA